MKMLSQILKINKQNNFKEKESINQDFLKKAYSFFDLKSHRFIRFQIIFTIFTLYKF